LLQQEFHCISFEQLHYLASWLYFVTWWSRKQILNQKQLSEKF